MQNELYIVADAIKALREARGLTQEQLAEKADISVSHLAKIETHARAMGMKTYIRLLEAMDIPIKEHFIHICRTGMCWQRSSERICAALFAISTCVSV